MGTFKVSRLPQSFALHHHSTLQMRGDRHRETCQFVCGLHMNGALLNYTRRLKGHRCRTGILQTERGKHWKSKSGRELNCTVMLLSSAFHPSDVALYEG